MFIMICFDNHSRVTVLVLSLLMYLLTTTTLTTLSLPHLSDLINNAHVNLSPMTPLDVISYFITCDSRFWVHGPRRISTLVTVYEARKSLS